MTITTVVQLFNGYKNYTVQDISILPMCASDPSWYPLSLAETEAVFLTTLGLHEKLGVGAGLSHKQRVMALYDEAGADDLDVTARWNEPKPEKSTCVWTGKIFRHNIQLGRFTASVLNSPY